MGSTFPGEARNANLDSSIPVFETVPVHMKLGYRQVDATTCSRVMLSSVGVPA